VLNSRWL